MIDHKLAGMILEVIKLGNPKLREVCDAVDLNTLQSDEMQRFIDDLISTMRDKNGAGIAASQVGVLKRIFIMECSDNPRYPDRDGFPLTVVINPSIKFIEKENQVDSWEGCLSIPGLRGKLSRFSKVELSGYDRDGNTLSKTLEGFEAVVAQHELDHLDGILFVDRMKDMKHLAYNTEYLKYWHEVEN